MGEKQVLKKIQLLSNITERKEADAFLIFSPQYHKENYRFLTKLNFIGPFSVMLYIQKTGTLHVLYASVWDVKANEGALFHVSQVGLLHRDCKELTDILQDSGVKRLALSGSDYITTSLMGAIRRAGATIILAEKDLPMARMQKTTEEIGYMRQAVALADGAWKVFMNGVAEGLNEYEICAEVEHDIKRKGAEDCFMLLATGGKEVRGMTPPMMRTAKPGDMVRTEVTPQVNGWWAQICRTCVKGKANDDQKRAFEIFLESEEAGLAMIRPGVNIKDVAKAENDVFRKYGYGEYCTEKYTRVRGHGHGLDLDEMPLVLESSDLVLKENMVVVIHPNTYSPLCGYMVFGDPVLITADGYEMLSHTKRQLFEV
jgi:Xaa-Pro aminopeptidase